MPRLLFIPDADAVDSATKLRWQLTRPHGETAGECALVDVPREPAVIAVLPLTRIAFIDALLPPVAARKRDELLAFAIEDKLTIDPSTIHAVVLGPSLSGANRHVVAAVDKRWLSGVLSSLRETGLTVSHAVAVSALHSPPTATWLAQFDADAGFAVRPDGLAFALDALDADASTPFPLQLALNEARASGANAVPTKIEVVAARDIPAGAWRDSLQVAVEKIAARPLQTTSDITHANLLTGDFAPRERTAVWQAALRPAAAIAAVVIALQVLFTALDAWQLVRERSRIETEMKATFQTAFPQATTIVDARLQMSRNLADLKRERGMATDAALMALAQLAKDAPGVSAVIKGIAYNGQSVDIQLDGAAPQVLTPGASVRTVEGKTIISLPAGGAR